MTTVDLLHRGKSTIDHIELFDECEFGADRLHYRGCFGTLWEIAYQIAFALNDTEAKNKVYEAHKEQFELAPYQDFDGDLEKHTPADFGCGNPMEENATQGIALNRYDVPEKLHNRYKSELYPHHADYFVQFMIRPKFWADHGYVTLGIKWDDELVEQYKTNGIKVSDLKVVSCQMISPRDSQIILDTIIYEAIGGGSIVPQGFLPVKSVLFDGNTYVQTNANQTANSFFTVKLEVQPNENEVGSGIGVQLIDSIGSTIPACFFISDIMNNDVKVSARLNRARTNDGGSPDDVEASVVGIHEWKIGWSSLIGGSGALIDNVPVIKNRNSSWIQNNPSHNFYICSYHHEGEGMVKPLKARFYAGTHQHNTGTILNNWIPCKNIKTGECCICDTVSKEIFYGIGGKLLP